ncbi:MAG TPA: hypothetical protein VGL56_05500 [Fimbriimonadaceae bacterium]|jgi:hypothetical protein
MKRISKVSLAVVLGAALASAAFAQKGKQDNRGPAPAPAHSAPARVEAPHNHAPAPQRTVQVNTQQRVSQPAHNQFNPSQSNGPRQISQGLPTHEQVAGHQGIGVRTAGDNAGKVGNGQTGNGNQGNTGHDGNTTSRTTGFGNTGTVNHNTNNNNPWGNGNGNQNNANNNPWGNNNSGRVDTSKIHDYKGNKGNGFRQDYQRRDNGPAFSFGFYLSAPTVDCVLSPWYAYPTLPAYLPLNEVVVDNGINVNWHAGTYYNYASYTNAPLTEAVDEIARVFTAQDLNYVPGLVGGGQVNIFNNGQYEYSVNGADFQQMLQDNVDNTQTLAFRITNVRTNGNTATVDAAHTFNDANGNTETVYQEYRLTASAGIYSITGFSTSTTPL